MELETGGKWRGSDRQTLEWKQNYCFGEIDNMIILYEKNQRRPAS